MSEAPAGSPPVLMAAEGPGVVLASASAVRRRLLSAAGIAFDAEAAAVDEAAVKESLKAEGATAGQAAETLAELKAQRLSGKHPGALVIGADQILTCNEVWFDKPPDRAHAAAHLRALTGKTHQLHTAVCVLRGGTRLWHHNAAPSLTMRSLSDAFIAAYLETVGEDALSSVGAYQLEGPGVQLFAAVEGDYFTILGLPLLPLLDFLRANRVLAP